MAEQRGPFVRGQVVWVRLAGHDTEKPYVVVSNNMRNAKLDSFLAVRVTTTQKPDIRSIYKLPPNEPVAGHVLCDEITLLWVDEVIRAQPGLSPRSLMGVSEALKAALAL